MFKIVPAIIIGLICFSLGISVFKAYGTQDSVVATVQKQERVCSSNSEGHLECKYLVFTDKEVFENTDEFLRFKFNSSDIYAKLKDGQTYEFTLIGWRLNFFSMYRNIIDVRSNSQ